MGWWLAHSVLRLIDRQDRVEFDAIVSGRGSEAEAPDLGQDIARVIGRDGRIANASRSLLKVMATKDGRHVDLEIVSDAE